MDDDQLLAHLHSQLTGLTKKLAILERDMEEKYGGSENAHMDKISRGNYLVLQGAIMRERAYVEWLKWSIGIVKTNID